MTDTLKSQVEEKRLSNALKLEGIREARLSRLEKREVRRRNVMESMTFDWFSPYMDLLDRFRREPEFSGPSNYFWRRYGRNYPMWQSENELNLLRAPARILCSINNYAVGLVEGLTSYVLGDGMTYRAAKKRKTFENKQESDAIGALADACQDVIDEFLMRNRWYGGDEQGLEEEIFQRTLEDGEAFWIHYAMVDGTTEIRTAEPEQCTAPPKSDQKAYSFGILTPENDVQRRLAYWFYWGDTFVDGEEYSADEVTHFRRNVKRSIKRGLTDFSFDQLDAFELAGRLRTNLGDAAAQQASIVAIRQHKSGQQSDVQAVIDADADWQEQDPITALMENVKRQKRGSWEDIPESYDYVPGPIAQSQPIHLQVLQGLVRSAGARWNAPPWLISGETDANFAGALATEAPFTRRIVRAHRDYGEAYKRTMWIVLKNWHERRGIYAAGRNWTWDEIRREIEVVCEAPSAEPRNRLQEAQQAAIEIPLGVDSRQRYAQSQGRDWPQIEADNQEFLQESGGLGNPLPMPGNPTPGRSPGSLSPPPETKPPYLPSHLRPESLLESLVNRVLLEKGYTGIDSNGHQWVDGKQVKRGDQAGGGSAPGFDAIAEHIPEPEREKAKGFFGRMSEAAHGVAMHLAIKLGEAAPDILDTAADYSRIFYAAGAGKAVSDPFHEHFGIGPQTVAVIASHVLSRSVSFVRAKLGRKESTLELGNVAQGVVDVFTALAEEIGGLPVPKVEDVQAWLGQRKGVEESLRAGSSDDVVSYNIAELIRAGHSREQAAKIAYKNAGRK